jgi:hypothetical protein
VLAECAFVVDVPRRKRATQRALHFISNHIDSPVVEKNSAR